MGASSGLSKLLFVEVVMYSTPEWVEIVDNFTVISSAIPDNSQFSNTSCEISILDS
jgi:hypothetical protein